MPYTMNTLPATVKKMSEHDQRQWLAVFNSAMADGDSEEKAFAKAYGVVKKDLDGDLVDALYQVETKWYGMADDDEPSEVTIKTASLVDRLMERFKELFLIANESKAEWTVAYINDLPDSAFAVIKGGGKKDDEGKTVPRTLRMLPHHNAGGGLDREHVANAMSRANQANTALSSTERSHAIAHLQAHEKTLGMAGADKTKAVAFLTLKDEGTGRTRFFCWPSNNFKDKHGEIIPAYAHQEFVQWCDTHKEYPELRVWHTAGTRLGEVDWLEVSDGLLAASGLIDEGAETRLAALEAMDIELGMSHGMKCLVSSDGEIFMYRSYEFSILPEASAASVPGGTGFALLSKESDMAFTDTKKAFLGKLGYTESQIAEYEQKTMAMSEELKAAGYEWKEVDLPVSSGVVEEEVDTKLRAALAPFSDTQQQLIQAVTAMAAKINELQKSEDERISNHIESAIARMPQGFKASESTKTALTKEAAAPSVDWFSKEMANVLGQPYSG